MSRAWIEVDRSAIAENAKTLRGLTDGSQLCGVVKANGYGHGAVTAAEGCLAGGADFLAVAQVAEGVELRAAGIDGPIWILSEPEPQEFATAAANRLEPAVYSERGITAAEDAGPMTVHLLVDSGMNRSGHRWETAPPMAERIDRSGRITLGSVWTHLAVADEPGEPFTDTQLDRFDEAVAAIEQRGIAIPFTHTANSGATVGVPRAHRDVVRPGLSLYGIEPSPDMSGLVPLRPAMRLVTRVAYVKRIDADDVVGYGCKGRVDGPTTAATIPIGYADGIRRESWERGGAALVNGERMPFLGRVSMDQIVLNCGDHDVAAGDEVVLIGSQGGRSISVESIAADLGTISNEVVCDLGRRLDRVPIDR
ncbi:MAG: alanine racemase [Actinomycetota bacterium]